MMSTTLSSSTTTQVEIEEGLRIPYAEVARVVLETGNWQKIIDWQQEQSNRGYLASAHDFFRNWLAQALFTDEWRLEDQVRSEGFLEWSVLKTKNLQFIRWWNHNVSFIHPRYKESFYLIDILLTANDEAFYVTSALEEDIVQLRQTQDKYHKILNKYTHMFLEKNAKNATDHLNEQEEDEPEDEQDKDEQEDQSREIEL